MIKKLETKRGVVAWLHHFAAGDTPQGNVTGSSLTVEAEITDLKGDSYLLTHLDLLAVYVVVFVLA